MRRARKELGFHGAKAGEAGQGRGVWVALGGCAVVVGCAGLAMLTDVSLGEDPMNERHGCGLLHV